MSAPSLAFLVPSFYGGGAEIVMIRLANEFARRGRPVDLVAFRPEGEHRHAVEEGPRLVDLGAPGPLRAPWAIRRYLASSQPDLLVTALPAASLAAAAAKLLSPGLETRLVITEHAPMTPYAVSERSWRGPVFRWLAPPLYRLADQVVGVSEAMVADVRAFTGLPAERVSAVANPVCTPGLLAAARSEVAEPLWPESDEPVLVTAGRLEREKDHATLLRAFALLQERRPSRLVVFGQGSLRGELERLATELGLGERVQFAGYVGEPLPHWARANLFVLASRYEGFSIVLVEALACGLRVVSTDCPSGPREILEGGRFGRLTPVGDAEALARAMDESLGEAVDPERQRSRAADFGVERSVDEYEALFERLLGRR